MIWLTSAEPRLRMLDPAPSNEHVQIEVAVVRPRHYGCDRPKTSPHKWLRKTEGKWLRP